MKARLLFMIIVAAGIVGWLVLRRVQRRRPIPRRWLMSGRILLGGLLVASALYAASRPLARRFACPVQQKDIFHTAIGSKYYEELGQYRMYECIYLLDAKGDRLFADATYVLNLRTLKIQLVTELVDTSACEQRFTEERRSAFLRDVELMSRPGPCTEPRSIYLTEFGYYGTPFHALVAATVFRFVPLREDTLVPISLVDDVLVGIAFLLVLWAFGPRSLLLGVAFYFCNYFRFGPLVILSGSFLRTDHVALVIAGVALLGRRCHALAGVVFGVAVMSRIYPIIFVVGFAIPAIIATREARAIPREARRFFIGFGVAVAVCLLATALAWTDWHQVWREFFARMSVRESTLTAQPKLGLKSVLRIISGGEGQSIGFTLTHGIVAAGGLVLTAKLLARRLSETSFVIVFGCLAYFALFASDAHYYAILVLLFFVKGQGEQGTFPTHLVIALLVSAASFAAPLLAGDRAGTGGYKSNWLVAGRVSVVLLVMWIAVVAALYFLSRWTSRSAPAATPLPGAASE